MVVGDEGELRFEFSPEQVRVLGCLVEKQLTTPQQYPLTLNALTLACNQTSNRFPVVAYDEATVELAVRTLKQAGMTRFVHPSHGRSVLRYEHLLDQVLGLDQRQLAILAVLLVRGSQTMGELRSRTERMVGPGALADLAHELELLSEQAGGLVAPVGRRPGQKEDRFGHLLGIHGSEASIAQSIGGAGDTALEERTSGLVASHVPDSPAGKERASIDRSGIAGLVEEVRLLRRQLDEVRTALGMDDQDR